MINFVALTSAMSSANSGVFSSTRMLYGLSVEKHAHWQFRILSRSTRKKPVMPWGIKAVGSVRWLREAVTPSGEVQPVAIIQPPVPIRAIMVITLIETRDPQRILPKAINALPLRIIIFYLLSMVVIIAVASWPGAPGHEATAMITTIDSR